MVLGLKVLEVEDLLRYGAVRNTGGGGGGGGLKVLRVCWRAWALRLRAEGFGAVGFQAEG